MEASPVEIWNVLKNLYFPLTKQNLIQQAMKHGANRERWWGLSSDFQTKNTSMLPTSARCLKLKKDISEKFEDKKNYPH